MYLLYNPSHDPAFNLAFEEYALTQMDKDIIMLWRNDRSVIIGSNQNAVEEMDLDYIGERGITVIRRQSGGGAVFHDLGNINFTVIHAMGKDDFNNYSKFTAPIVDFLATLGVEAELKGRNDLLIDGMKFSGNAQAVRGGRIMHHGTILYDADFGDLAGALRPSPAKIESKGIKSVRSRVTNVASHLPSPMPVEEFLDLLYRYYLESGTDMEEYTATPADIAAVNKLVEEKYGTWEWNFGHSPAYDYRREEAFPFGLVDLRLQVAGGVIRSAVIYGDFFGIGDKAELETRLAGLPHRREAILEALSGVDLGRYISGITAEAFAELF
ncbi:MAG: lipoate--protein ligase [Oscillospiraceae bacterium]